MAVDTTEGSTRPVAATPPLLFISHRHADSVIADVLRKFINDRSGGRIRVFQSSSAVADGTRVGRELNKQLQEHLWEAGVVLLIYTSTDEDWSYCMWECGVATHPLSPETKIVVIQCGPRPPAVYSGSVRVNAQDPRDIQKFVNDFLTASDFFPNYGEAVAPGFFANGDEVRDAARELHDRLSKVLPASPQEGDDWATVPFLRLILTYAEVDKIRELNDADGSRQIQEAARIGEMDEDAKRIFGLGLIRTGTLEQLEPFSRLTDVWRDGRPKDSTQWIDEVCEQIRVASHWQRLPPFRWRLMRSVDDFDRAKYSPILSRVRSFPRQRFHQFEIYFSRFDTDEKGAVKIGLDTPVVETD